MAAGEGNRHHLDTTLQLLTLDKATDAEAVAILEDGTCLLTFVGRPEVWTSDGRLIARVCLVHPRPRVRLVAPCAPQSGPSEY